MGSRDWLSAILLMGFALAGAPAGGAQDAKPIGESAADLPAVVNVLRAGTPLPTTDYIRQHFAPTSDSSWVENRLAQIAAFKARTGGLEEVTVTAQTPVKWTLQSRENLTGWWIPVTIVMDSTAPHRVVSFSAGAARPRNSAAAKLLTEDELVAEVSKLVRAYCAGDVFSGVVAIASGNTMKYSEACGDAIKGERPNTVDTRFNLASANKMFTAIAIARLIEAGKLSLRDSVAAFLPGFPTPEASRKIRIVHLLTHTSGLSTMFPEEWEQGSKTRFRNLDDYINLVRGQPLIFEPGTKTQYSNTGFLVLGKIIEVVTGRSYFDYVTEQVLVPARMTSTCHCELDQPNPGMAIGYQKKYGTTGVTYQNNLYTEVIKGTPAGGAFSTAADMIRFATALDAGELVGRPLVQTFTTPKPDLHPDLTNYGYGFITRRKGLSFGHNGGSTGVGVDIETFRDRGYTMAVLANYGSIAGELAERIRTLMIQGVPQ